MLTEQKVRHMKGWLKEPRGGEKERGSPECVKSQVTHALPCQVPSSQLRGNGKDFLWSELDADSVCIEGPP